MKPDQSNLAAPTTNEPTVVPKRRRTPQLRRNLVIGLPLLVLVATSLWLIRPDAEGTTGDATPPPLTEVTVARVVERRVADQTERIGRVVPTQSVELRPEVSGRIVQIGFAAGERVQAGQMLFAIDPQPYAAAVNAARAHVARVHARAETASRESQRADHLESQNAISRQEADLLRSRVAETQAELLAAQAALAAAEIDLDRTQVRAPIAGRVSRAYVTEGNLVSGNPSGSTLLTTIVSTGEAHVLVNVDEATVYRLRSARQAGVLATDSQGRVPVELKLDQSSHWTHLGHVESLDNRIDPTTGSLTVRLHFDDPSEQLLAGSFVRVRVPVSAAQPRLVIDERAIGTDQSQRFVLVVQEDQTVAYRPIVLGPAIGDERVIESGLGEGERIIVNGLQRVRPGMTVAAAMQSAPPAPTEIAAR